MDDGGPAFPFEEWADAEGKPTNVVQYHGMSMRDYFAAKAMQAYAMQQVLPDMARPSDEAIAAWAYGMADAMLRARKVQP